MTTGHVLAHLGQSVTLMHDPVEFKTKPVLHSRPEKHGFVQIGFFSVALLHVNGQPRHGA